MSADRYGVTFNRFGVAAAAKGVVLMLPARGMPSHVLNEIEVRSLVAWLIAVADLRMTDVAADVAAVRNA